MSIYLNLSDNGDCLSAGEYATPPSGDCVEIDAIPTENGVAVDTGRLSYVNGKLMINPPVEPAKEPEIPSLEQRTEALEAAVLEIIMGVAL